MIEPGTKLPWAWYIPDRGYLSTYITTADPELAPTSENRFRHVLADCDSPRGSQDAAYIVHAANNYPKAIEALEPFSDIADEGNEDQPDDTPCTIHAGRSICYGFTLGQFRALRRLFAILSQAEEPRP